MTTMSKEEKLSKFGAGPWMDEPDRVEFRHAGFVCLLNRNNCGAWCGYVGVAPGHPWHGKSYDAVHDMTEVEVHGGLTYSEECNGEICHVPEPGEPEHLYWLGFDCAHSGDLVPYLAALSPFDRLIKSLVDGGAGAGDAYRDLAYVRVETEQLAEQARAAAEKAA